METGDAKLASVRAWMFLSALTLGEWGSAGRCSWCASVGGLCCRTLWPKPQILLSLQVVFDLSMAREAEDYCGLMLGVSQLGPNWVPTHGSQLKTREAFPEKKGGLGYSLKRIYFNSFY